MRDFRDSTEVIEDGAELYERLQHDGYLFLRSVIPGQVLASARRDLAAIAKQNRWLAADTATEAGVANLEEFCAEPEPAYRKVFRQMYSLESVHAIQHHPALVALFERILATAVLSHPRTQLRVVFPRPGDEDHSTRAHQDFLKVQGTTDTFTAWIPLSDCPKEMGTVAIAEGSHTKLREFQPAPGYGLVEVIDSFPDEQWVSGDYQLGDLSIHHSLAVHKALPNTTARLRFSLDCRYQRISDPINEKCLNPNAPPLTWPDIYKDWRHSDLQYYWQNYKLDVRPFDATVNGQRDELALAAGARGDRSMVPTLKLIAYNNPDPDKRQRANQLLHSLEIP